MLLFFSQQEIIQKILVCGFKLIGRFDSLGALSEVHRRWRGGISCRSLGPQHAPPHARYRPTTRKLLNVPTEQSIRDCAEPISAVGPVTIRYERLKALAVSGRKIEADSCSHAPDLHAVTPGEFNQRLVRLGQSASNRAKQYLLFSRVGPTDVAIALRPQLPTEL